MEAAWVSDAGGGAGGVGGDLEIQGIGTSHPSEQRLLAGGPDRE